MQNQQINDNKNQQNNLQKCPHGFQNAGIGCYKPIYSRGLGNKDKNKVCPGDAPCELQDQLWYPICDPGYEGRNSECIKTCPANWQDVGPICIPQGQNLAMIMKDNLGETNSVFIRVDK